ncbi:MAG: Holliday junction branch migration protein RuvA [bacterium]
MIAWLKGQILEVDENELIIDTNGVGYRVQIGSHLKLQKEIRPGGELELAIYTAVKEDGIRLFGFQNFFARKVFILLLSVNGIGPKVALKIVDQVGPSDILKAIKSNNAAMFTNVSGVGKKTAQRIILDLQGKLDILVFDGQFGSDSDDRNAQNILQGQREIVVDAVSALSNLGFSVKVAENIIAKHLTPGAKLDELIRKCLVDLRKVG